MATNHVYKRGNRYVYRRRVPTFIRYLDSRKEVKISLKTPHYQEAVLRAAIYDQQMEAFWRSLVETSDDVSFESRYKAAVSLARSYGFAYKTIDQVASAPLSEIVERLTVDLETNTKAEALLGGAGSYLLKLSDCPELFWELVHDRVKNKSEHQLKKWRNPREAAFKNFVAVVGDKGIHEIVRSDVLSFRSWWNKRLSKGLSANTANKQLHFVKDILNTVAIQNEIDIDYDLLFVKTNFRDEKRSRPPFEAQYVQNVLLPGLEGLTERDRFVLWAIADTGARVSEIFGLIKEDIRLDEEIPFIWIRPRNGYSLKTRTSQRQIPLVGSGLKAFRAFPNGFGHDQNPDSYSTRVNKYLLKQNLKPTSQHSIYSLRHTFKDRLRDIEAPEEIIDDLMGHKKSGPKYGRGHRLESKLKWLSRIEYRV